MTPDLLVVGGGPAGATLAGLAARAGARVLVVDAAYFPRPKACGECLNPGAVAALQRLGSWSAVQPLQGVALTGWRLSSGPVSCSLHFPADRCSLAIPRWRLDHALLSWVADQGADVHEGCRVTDLLWDRGRVTGVTLSGACGERKQVLARWVVGADGLRSVVLRRLGLMARSTHAPKVALTAHWSDVAGLDDRGELHFDRGLVCGIAPVGGGEANVVVVMSGERARAVGRDQAGVLRNWPGLGGRFAGASPVGPVLATGPFERPVHRPWAPGAILVGDAAGYFDPLTGQGIYRALRSAELAAAALAKADGASSETAALIAYEHRLATEFGPGLRLQRRLDRLCRRPGLLQAGIALLAGVPAARRWLASRVGDCTDSVGR